MFHSVEKLKNLMQDAPEEAYDGCLFFPQILKPFQAFDMALMMADFDYFLKDMAHTSQGHIEWRTDKAPGMLINLRSSH